MFCNNCNVFVDDRSNFCPECGGPVIKKKPKFSVVSIISLIMIIIAIAPFFASFIFATESSLGDGAGWLIFIIAFITIPLTGYYAAIFHVSRSWDRERPYKNTRKNLLVILFLSIPCSIR